MKNLKNMPEENENVEPYDYEMVKKEMEKLCIAYGPIDNIIKRIEREVWIKNNKKPSSVTNSISKAKEMLFKFKNV